MRSCDRCKRPITLDRLTVRGRDVQACQVSLHHAGTTRFYRLCLLCTDTLERMLAGEEVPYDRTKDPAR